MYKPKGNIALYVTVAAITVFTVIFCIVYSKIASYNLEVNLNYYFVYQYTVDNVLSASSLSSATESYGGAGYILSHNGKYYVTVACYYDETSANSVRFNLKNLGMECEVLAVSLDKKPVSQANYLNRELFLGNINTLEQLGKLAYDCANVLDKGELTQSGAADTLAAVRSGLNGLYVANEQNCFASELYNLLTFCGEVADSGYLYSKNVRKLQIAIIDCILNVKMT